MSDWHIYTGVPGANSDIGRLPAPPPWRVFDGGPVTEPPDGAAGEAHQALSYRADADVIEQVNAALYLRRPLLVTGHPGTGKSSLAYAVARELALGPVLYWPITSRVTVHDGLYSYDPLTRLYRASLHGASQHGASLPPDGAAAEDDIDVGRYIRLGPLGTALLPFSKPRVLLIDEVDKGDIDFPNDLLTIFEKGEYEISELLRSGARTSAVATSDGDRTAEISHGRVRCNAFPFVVMTSNGEREFPPAFLRRCITVDIAEPGRQKLREIVAAHLADLADESGDLIELFLSRRDTGQLATDQLLHAVYLAHHAARMGPVDRAGLAERIMPFLSGELPVDED
jgi:MoxR-like ATPase